MSMDKTMDGGHSHSHGTEDHIRFGIFLNLSFAFLELALGFVANSMAILSDAIHDFVDSGSLFLSLLAARQANRRADVKRSFGYRRFSVLAALFNSGLLIAGALVIIYHAAVRLFSPPEVRSSYLLVVAGLSIVFNGAAVLCLRKEGGEDINLQAAAWHLLEDALGGIALLIGGAAIRLTGWAWIDSVLAIGLSVVVLRGTVRVFYTAVHILLEGTPTDVDPDDVQEALLSISGVADVHHLHVWALDTSHYNMSVHIVLEDEDLEPELYRQVEETVRPFKITHVTVQAETQEGMCGVCCHH